MVNSCEIKKIKDIVQRILKIVTTDILLNKNEKKITTRGRNTYICSSKDSDHACVKGLGFGLK
jgi:23S rRNA maturation mini-RNase III